MAPWFFQGLRLRLRLPRAVHARRAGSIDGREQIPAPEDREPPGWVRACLHAGQNEVTGLHGAWTRLEHRLRARLEAARLQAADAEATAAEADAFAQRCQRHLETVAARAAALDETLNPPGHWYFPTPVYLIGLAGLALLDVPLVYMAFQAFGLDALQTLLLSLLTGLLTSAIGHFGGSLLRRVQVPERLQFYALGVLALSLVGAVGFLREDGLAALRTLEDVPVSPWRSFAGLVLVSLASLAVALLIAAHHRLEPLAAQMRRAVQNWNRAVHHLEKARRARLTALRREVDLRGRLEAIRSVAREQVAMAEAETMRLIGIYTAANVLAREGHQLVPCLEAGNLPRLCLPTEFRQERLLDPIKER